MKYAEIWGPLLGLVAAIAFLLTMYLVPPYSPPLFLVILAAVLAFVSVAAFLLGVHRTVEDRRIKRRRAARERALKLL